MMLMYIVLSVAVCLVLYWLMAGRITLEQAYRDKVVILTGASDGVGKVMATYIANAGGQLDRLEKAEKEIKTNNSAADCISVVCDIGIEQNIDNLIEVTLKRYGRIDYIINNAALQLSVQPFLQSTDPVKNCTTAINTNYMSNVHLLVKGYPHLQKTSGLICAVTSMGGVIPAPFIGPYAASKRAVHGLFESVQIELDHDPNNRVKVSLLPLIYVETETAVSTTGGTLSSGISVNKAGHDMALGWMEHVFGPSLASICPPLFRFSESIVMRHAFQRFYPAHSDKSN